jgi:hypothetical protein
MRAIGHAAAVTLVACSLAITAGLTVARRAAAEEPVTAGEPRLMSETAEVTSVIDAFDNDDPFDVNLVLGFQQSWKSSKIRRETNLNQPGLSNQAFVSTNENVASYSQSTSTLNMGADIGIYKDLAFIFRVPLILNDSRSLGDLNGSQAIQNLRLADPSGQQLFSLPFSSPSRSGVDYFLIGLDWAITNQQRDRTKPTWVVGVQGRISVGAPLHACNANAPQGVPSCPDPAWRGLDGNTPDQSRLSTRDPGISRGTDAVEIHTLVSRRFGYVEPYTGFKALVEFAQYGDMAQTNGLQGALLNHPPLVGTFLLGMEVIPWERREQFQRLVGDIRLSGMYHSAGREYSELFDALGSSTASSLRSANPSSYKLDTDPHSATLGKSIGDSASQQIFFNGVTDQQAYGSLGLHGSATWQAGEYIKFVAGLGVTFNQSHLITAADSCNPDLSSLGTAAAGPCKGAPSATTTNLTTVTGVPNPNHRDVIDLPGHRFSADATSIVDLFIQGVVMF